MTMQAEIVSSGWSVPGFVQRNRILLALVMGHLGLGLALGQILETEFHSSTVSSLMLILGTMLPIFLVLLMLGRFLHLALVVRPKRPTQQMLSDVRAVFLDADRVVTGIVAVLAFSIFISSFSYFKSVIPEIQPFAWDVRFAELDRMLHFGYDPYVPVMALFGTPKIVTLFNGFYHAWMFLICMSVLLAAFAKRDAVLRNTYLIGFVLVWFIAGNVLATLFSSAGPVYYERLGLGDDFVPLTQMLKEFNETSPVWALSVHEMLWEGYVAEGKARGISAMPSMHVGSTALMMIFAYGWKRWAGHLAAVFVAIIVIGSVMLAWHYAVDAYLGLIAAWACWKSAGRIAAWDAARQS